MANTKPIPRDFRHLEQDKVQSSQDVKDLLLYIVKHMDITINANTAPENIKRLLKDKK